MVFLVFQVQFPVLVHLFMKQFSSEVISKLKYYVYLLSDPSNGEIFYVGKGKGNRAFSHFKEIIDSDKVNKIKEIKKRD